MAKQRSRGDSPTKSRGLRRGQSEIADWETIDASSVIRAIAAAAKVGGALRFGYSRDGFVYSIGIYGDGDPYTEYVKPTESVEDTLKDILELFEAIADESKQAPNGLK